MFRRRAAALYAQEVGRIHVIKGRAVISRADLGAWEFPRSTVERWYRNRSVTGFPAKAGRIGSADYWFEDEFFAWHSAHVNGRLTALPQADRAGDPDDLLDAQAAARILGYSGRDAVRAARRAEYLPRPVDYVTTANGAPGPRWRRSMLWALTDARPSKGGGRPSRLSPRTAAGY